MKLDINLNHDIKSLRIKENTLERLKKYVKLYEEYGTPMNNAVDHLLDDFYKNHRPKPRNSKGQFIKKE